MTSSVPDIAAKMELGGHRSEVRGHRSELTGPRSELRGPRSELRGPRSELRGPGRVMPENVSFLKTPSILSLAFFVF